jgi:hypothetical protein
VHAEPITTETEDQDMAGVRIDFRSRQDEDSVASGQVRRVIRRPEIVMLGDANPVQPGGSGGVSQFVGGQEAVIGFGVGMVVEIDQHWGSER